MKTIRVFTVEVSGCFECKHRMGTYCCHTSLSGSIFSDKRADVFDENVQAITPTCPRYGETKLIEVKE